MFEELEIIKSIVTELSGAGLWFGLAYVAYLLISKVLLVVGSIWIINEISKRVVSVLKADITKDQAEELKRRVDEADKEARKAKAHAETIIHKYEILTGKGDDKSV